jgi:potassium channel subfamily K
MILCMFAHSVSLRPSFTTTILHSFTFPHSIPAFLASLLHTDPLLYSDWWFASTAIPILAATLGPLANVLSIGALVTSWRVSLHDPNNPANNPLPELQGIPIKDPTWCYWINVASLIMGFVGNLFLLLNMQNRIRYIVSLPLTIILWFLACGLLIGDLAAMYVHARPTPETELFSAGYWYGIAASCVYLVLSLLLMVNLLGYIRGHYPQHFDLTDDQRTLIVQTMIFFIWLGGGAAVYSRIEGWHWVDGVSSLPLPPIPRHPKYPSTPNQAQC